MTATGLPSSLDSSSTGSMVEIQHADAAPPVGKKSPEDDHYRLVYTKSKVYVHPTAYARDNIPGFVALVKREAVNPIYLLAWLPESLLNERGSGEWDKFVKIEEQAALDELDEDIVLIDLPSQKAESYAFSVPLTSIYSLIAHPPSLSSWYGSIAINLINGDTLPTLHFHDDESRSFSLPTPPSASSSSSRRKRNSLASYPPPAAPSPPSGSRTGTSWGGEDLIARLRSYAHILRSNLQPSLYLIDPSRQDIETHTTQIFDDDAVDDILAQSSYANSHSPVPAHRRPRPLSVSSSQPNLSPNPYSARSSVLHRSLAPTAPNGAGQSPSQARTALLQSFSNITRATRHAAQNILSHPLAKPIVPHLPDPVKTFVNANGEWSREWGSWVEKGGVGEFESARVYLARWARIVAEEGERARRREAQAIPSSGGDLAQETSSLGIFELLHSTSNLPTPKTSRDPAHPVDEKMWKRWFAPDGRPKVRIEEVKHEVFRRGIMKEGTLRRRIWPFLLGVYVWDVDGAEREARWHDKMREYHRIKNEWCGNAEVYDLPQVVEERHRIDVDCRRTDRTQPLFSSAHSPEDVKRQRRVSTISPQTADIGAQSPSNEHIDRMAGILLTYNFYEKELGYVQGMSDLCAPLYVVMGPEEEELVFWCFVEVMNRMVKQNFLRDQSGMKRQLSTLQDLIAVMDPELYRHLEKTDALNLFFCFRWVLIAFKREFPFDDVLRLWEVLWTDYYSNEFVLFVALAVLESHRDVILRYLVEFDEILKYCNDLSMTIELDSTLAQAEVLFLSFAQLIADIDRRKAEEISASSSNLRRRATLGSKSAGSISSIEGAEAEKKADESKIQEADDAKDEDTKKDGDAKKDDDANADKAEGKKVPTVNLPVISDNLRDLLKAGR
ncbi:RabGAP/TBC [Schizophyllum commune Loenen D]|nr:RabGAP/TBC [Schizophyllum commune Loenen D]